MRGSSGGSSYGEVSSKIDSSDLVENLGAGVGDTLGGSSVEISDGEFEVMKFLMDSKSYSMWN